MDSRCVTNQRPLLDSGTLGAKGHVQVITQLYTTYLDYTTFNCIVEELIMQDVMKKTQITIISNDDGGDDGDRDDEDYVEDYDNIFHNHIDDNLLMDLHSVKKVFICR